MGQVSVFINGRSYRLGCDDGEEQRLHELARHVSGKVENLIRDMGDVGGERLFMMASLLLADEALDAREALRQALADRVDDLKATLPGATDSSPAPPQHSDADADATAETARTETTAAATQRATPPAGKPMLTRARQQAQNG
jgi:cell division protein ZapA